MAVAYIAYTERSVLLLDDEGVCVRVEPLRGRGISLGNLAGPRRAPQNDGALRCIGAQYVASIDPTAPGGLSHLPRAGTSMLFAAADPSGRIFCVRAGPITHFESSAGDDSGVHSTPNDTQRQGAMSRSDRPDPGFGVSLSDEDCEELTIPFETPRPSSVPPPPPRALRSPRDPGPPPTPRVPRLRGSSNPESDRAAPDTLRVPHSTPPPSDRMAVSPREIPGRGRPPSPSTHAWPDGPPSFGWTGGRRQ